MPMRKSIMRTLAIATVAIIGVAGSAWFAMGDLRPAPVQSTPAAAQDRAPALKPSYIVTVRAPTPEEQAQRDALASAKPTRPVIDLTPSASIEVATVQTDARATVLSDVNVRSGPGTNSTTLTVASAGTRLPVVSHQGSWTQVTLPDGGNGWIASKFLAQ